MQLSMDTLKQGLQLSADNQGQKVIEIRLNTEKSAAVPTHGAMFIAVAQKGANHYLSHIDYKIMTTYDNMYSK